MRRQEAVKSDGLFPCYQGKTCDGTSPSGRICANLGGTAEVFRLLSQGSNSLLVFPWTGAVFSCPERPRSKGANTMANENIPYKIYLSEDEMPRTWYNVRADMKVKPAPCAILPPARRCRSTICAPCSAMN